MPASIMFLLLIYSILRLKFSREFSGVIIMYSGLVISAFFACLLPGIFIEVLCINPNWFKELEAAGAFRFPVWNWWMDYTQHSVLFGIVFTYPFIALIELIIVIFYMLFIVPTVPITILMFFYAWTMKVFGVSFKNAWEVEKWTRED